MATRRTRDMASFSWHGFLPERVPSLGQTFVELLIAFEPEEVSLTSDLFLAWQDSLPPERRQTWKIVPIQSGHGCIGCSESGFWDNGPFYQRLGAFPGFGIESNARGERI